MVEPAPLDDRNRRIDELVDAYRAGDVCAGAELLRMFRPLIQKYVQLCLTGKTDPKDWLQMKVLRGIHPDQRTAGEIIKRCMARIDRQDIEMDAVLSLLQAALHWRNISIGFRNLFLRRVLAYVRVATRETVFSDWEDDPEEEASLAIDLARHHGEDLDELWVLGATAGPGFDELSVQERQMLHLAYWLGYTDYEIAQRLNLSRMEVRALRQEAIEKAKIYLERVGRLPP